MAVISYDGQSFLIDSRRIWLVSGAIHYARTPRELWPRRIAAAREAGLNCIETYVFWNLHERHPKRFDFEGDKDLRHFVELCAAEGMFVILRPGPYVCAEWDFGGLPPWLHRATHPKTRKPLEVKLRQSNPVFLEATSRYLTRVLDEVRDLQITGPISGAREPLVEGNTAGAPAGGYQPSMGTGPIVLFQAENEWLCHNPAEHDGYLREIVRYLRESGCEVPIVSCNNLWQRVDGTIDCWNGAEHLAADMRQLAIVQPDAPRLVTEYWPGWFDRWGSARPDTPDAQQHLYRLGGILGAAAQYNLYMFHGGTNFGFNGGRSVEERAGFITTSYDSDAPLLEAGGRGPKFFTTKLISTFAAQFSALLAHLEPARPHAAIAHNDGDHPLSIVHRAGTQGDVVFVLKSENDKTSSVEVMLPDGLSLPVPLGTDRVAWFVRDANLGGVASLTYTNLRPWAFVDRKMLVLFGPPGESGLVCIDEEPNEVRVPAGQQPLVEDHDPITLVVLSREQVDAAYLFQGGLAVGCDGLDAEGRPRPLSDWTMTCVDSDGEVSRSKATPARKPGAPALRDLAAAPVTGLINGSDPAYESIEGPASHEQLKNDTGYGWYRITGCAGRTGKVLAPGSGDRLHVYRGGSLAGVLGMGVGAESEPATLKLDKDLVVMTDNLGRFSYGQRLGEQTGLCEHLYTVKAARIGKPKVVRERTSDPFAVSGYAAHQRRDENGPAESLLWQVKPDGRKPMVLEIADLPHPAVIHVNGEAVAFYNVRDSAHFLRLMLTPGEAGFTGGKNELKLGLLGGQATDLNVQRQIRLYQTTAALTAKAAWAFAPWKPPPAGAFGDLPGRATGTPTWYRAAFEVVSTDAPLWLEPAGMSKGQIYLNGHNVGRYWMATATGKAVPPQRHYYLPEPWLKVGKSNELLIFDEHGKLPGRCRLIYNQMGPFNK